MHKNADAKEDASTHVVLNELLKFSSRFVLSLMFNVVPIKSKKTTQSKLIMYKGVTLNLNLVRVKYEVRVES